MSISCRDGIPAIDGGRVVLQYRNDVGRQHIIEHGNSSQHWIECSLHNVFIGYLDIIIIMYTINTRVSTVVNQLCAVPSEATPKPPCTWPVSVPVSLRTRRKQP